MIRRYVSATVLAAAALVATGCEKPPVELMTNAKEAVEEARRAEGEQYAAKEFRVLQDSLQSGLAEVDKQNVRASVLRRYAQASKTLAWADSYAVIVSDKARKNKEELRQITEFMVRDAAAAVDSAASMVANAPRGKGTEQDIQLLEGDLNMLRATLEEARMKLQTEKFADAQASARNVQSGAERIQGEVQAVVQRYEELMTKARGQGRRRG